MSFKNITFNSYLNIDYFMYFDKNIDETNIGKKNIDATNKYYIPTWNDDDNLKILCTYDDGLLYSSSIKNLSSPLLGYTIYRQQKGENKLHKVAEVDKDCRKIVDYLVANNTQYTYIIIPITEKELGVASTGSAITTDWFDWSLTSIKEIEPNIYIPEDIWILQLEVTSDDIIQNISTNILYTANKYPKIVTGNNNFATGSLSCYLGNVIPIKHEFNSNLDDYVFNDTVERIKAWNNFVGNGKTCLLKDRKGMIYKVAISDNPYRNYNDELPEQPTTISFSFTEIGNIDNISVREIGGE